MSILNCEKCGEATIDTDYDTDYDTDSGHEDESGWHCEECWDEILKQGALDAGIPKSVIDGKTELSDHFSKEYIKYTCGKG